MSNSPRLGLPFLQAAQAQKHVTVNEALVRIDALEQLTLLSVSTATPPGLANDGDCYGVPTGAVNAWAGHENEIAIWSNGGWVFAAPLAGWSAHIVDIAASAIFNGDQWLAGAVALTANRAATIQEIIEIDHVVTAGASNSIAAAIPAHSVVFGVTGRVLTDITGTLSTWRLGVAASDNRYGAGLGLTQGSWVRGLTGSPQTYYANTDFLLTGEGGDFASGTVRLAIHLLRLNLPEL